MMNLKSIFNKTILKEFFRYVLVGGISFLADFGTLTFFEEIVFKSKENWQILVSTAAGFVVGLIINYILSLVFVFKKENNSSSGKTVGGFVVFTVVGIIGLGITEALMHLGVNILNFNYMLTKIVTAGIVLVWNYLGRKILVFSKPFSKNRKEKQ